MELVLTIGLGQSEWDPPGPRCREWSCRLVGPAFPLVRGVGDCPQSRFRVVCIVDLTRPRRENAGS